MIQLRHFSIDEFNCKCCGKNEMDYEFLQLLDHARTIAKIPFVITSGFRCEKHNKEIGGKPDSAHLIGHAADIFTHSLSDRFKIVKALLDVGFRRIGIAHNFIHVDNDPSKHWGVIWLY